MALIDRDALFKGLFGITRTTDLYGQGLARGIDLAIGIINDAPAVDAVPVVHGEWIYEIDRKPCYASYEVHAKCSECGWEWFSKDGVGNYSAVFGAFFTNYQDNPEEADTFLLDNAKKNNKFVYCPNCGARMDALKAEGWNKE